MLSTTLHCSWTEPPPRQSRPPFFDHPPEMDLARDWSPAEWVPSGADRWHSSVSGRPGPLWGKVAAHLASIHAGLTDQPSTAVTRGGRRADLAEVAKLFLK